VDPHPRAGRRELSFERPESRTPRFAGECASAFLGERMSLAAGKFLEIMAEFRVRCPATGLEFE
jgi:hypothetical protein